MDDLLASIRKIIHDDFGERSLAPLEPDSRPQKTERMEPQLSSGKGVDDGPLADIDAEVARSIADAFESVGDDVAAEDPDPGPTAPHRGRSDAELAEEARTLENIAAAIAAGSAEDRGDAASERDDWRTAVLSEPGLDGPEPSRSSSPAPFEAAPRALDDAAVNDRDRGEAERAPKKESRSPFSRIAALKANLEAQASRKADERAAEGAFEPAGPRDDAPAAADAPPSMPSNVFRLDPDQRTTDMSDIATEPTHDTDGPGNVFRRAAPPPPPRQDMAEDGLTSARTRQNVNQSFDQLSRTILNNNPRTLEDLVRDMVRPLLREWLEANLGEIVERQVRQEIDRVSAKGR